nr:unknown [Glycine max]
MPPFIGTISSNQNQVSVPLPKQHLMQEQQSGHFLPTSSGNSYRPINCMDDGLIFDNDFSLHELTVNAISNDIDDLFM